MKPITICSTFFKSLALANFEAALYSVRRQDLSRVEEIVIVDNDSVENVFDIQCVIDGFEFQIPIRLLSFKHGDETKTHAWSTNTALREASTPWMFFTRADYILDFGIVQKFAKVMDLEAPGTLGFITGNVYHLSVDVGVCETTAWRRDGVSLLRVLPGVEETYMCIDAGVWMITKGAFTSVGGLDETLTAWGHAQTHFQYKLHRVNVPCMRIDEPLFYHPQHAAPRDIELAHRQLADRGIELKELWARYDGVQPY